MNGKWKIIILIGIAVMLGAVILNQQKPKSSSQITPSPSTAPKLLSTNLTAEERFILDPPSVEASRSAKQKHAQTVAKLAKMGNTIETKNCQPAPLVLQVKQGSEFKIKNNDNTQHYIIFDEEHIYKIPANGDLTIKAQFKYGTGDYGYVCKGSGLVGFVHVTL